jgi:5,10-methylenetetrahydromethanopterin reductase
MRTHGEGGAQAAVLDDDFIDDFALVGPPGRCVERIEEIVALGFDRLWLSTPMDQGDAGQESYATSVSEVLPRLQSV